MYIKKAGIISDITEMHHLFVWKQKQIFLCTLNTLKNKLIMSVRWNPFVSCQFP